MTVAYGQSQKLLTKISELTTGYHYVDTEELLESNIFSAGDLDCWSCDSDLLIHNCMPTRKQFEDVWHRYEVDEDDEAIISYLMTDMRTYGQKVAANVVWNGSLFSVHNGHHRLYVCHVLNAPFLIDVGYD